MKLSMSEAAAARLEWLPSVGSTNDALVELASGPDPAAWPDLSVVATDTQTQGRGRLGREWEAPSGKCLAVSVLFRPADAAGKALPADALGWLPLLAGAAMTSVVRTLVGAGVDTVSLKWPNDVLIGSRKVCGILGELVPGAADTDGTAPAVVLGAGVNLTLEPDELPVPTATSLALAGVKDVSLDAVLSRYLIELRRLYDPFVAHRGDAVASGLHGTVTALCGTLGQPVRAELPGGDIVTGLAREIDVFGRLSIDLDGVGGHVDGGADNGADSDEAAKGSDSAAIGRRMVVAAGDITHLRY
jgi:BirA family biotin operon repressor/biotin-[acetyl-CoA-carboxylase] ligase